MKKTLMVEKIGMTDLMDEEGIVSPVTVLRVDEGVVLEVKASDKHGYQALVVGNLTVEEKDCNRPRQGQFKKWGQGCYKVIREIRVDTTEGYEVGSKIGIGLVEKGQRVDVRGRTIGRGHAGTIKRWNFRRGPMSHGSKSHRITGSIGGGTTPGRVLRGKKMSGHYGNTNRTVKNLEVIRVDADKNLVFVKGSVSGKPKNMLELSVD